MKLWSCIPLLGLITGCQTPTQPQTTAPVQSVASVDLNRYAGTWYEVAHLPMFFQRQCVGDTTALYTPQPDGSMAVTNRCRTSTGFDEARGKATPVEGGGNAKLKVSFFWPFKADYWVIGLDPEYRWALVGNPNRKYLWLLSRTPTLPADQQAKALDMARAQGFDLGALELTPHRTPGP